MENQNAITFVSQGESRCFFVSNKCFDVNDWNDDDPRIHKKPNCRYRDKRTYLDIIYELIKAGMLKSKFDKGVDI